MQQFYTNSFVKTLGVLIVVFLPSLHLCSQVFPVDTLMRNGQRSNRINLVYLSDGYRAADLTTFQTDATTLDNAFFSQSPFAEYKSFFNSFSINVPSTDTGAIHPNTAPDCPPLSVQPVDSPTTYFQSSFDYFSIHRLLVPLNYTGAMDVLANNLPDYDLPFMIVNSGFYGGSGGSLPAASTHASSSEIAIHEIGHSFAGLADEYWAGDAFAAERANMTAENDPDSVKWKNWLGLNDIGIYLVGTTTGGTAWYRPHQNCKMRVLGQPFCSVCTERLVDRIHELVDLVDSFAPATTSFTLSSADPVSFSVMALDNNPSTIGVRWYLNGSATPFAVNESMVNIPFNDFVDGTNTVRAEVVDSSALSKTYLPGAGYVSSITWNVTKPAVVPIHLISFSGIVNDQGATLTWLVDTPDDLDHFELERSVQGGDFSLLGVIARQGQSRKYTYNDPVLPGRINYYRLKMALKDGSSIYSDVIILRADPVEKLKYKVYQQAAARKYHLSVNLAVNQRIAMQVSDGIGRKLISKDFGNVESRLEFDFKLEGRPAGIYYVNLRIDNISYTIPILAN